MNVKLDRLRKEVDEVYALVAELKQASEDKNWEGVDEVIDKLDELTPDAPVEAEAPVEETVEEAPVEPEAKPETNPDGTPVSSIEQEAGFHEFSEDERS